jgi:DNA-binding HxlR family transcriptional regulator
MITHPYTHESCENRLREAIRQINARWKLPILANLHAAGSLRFSELERSIPDASQKMLTQHLRELEDDGIVSRKVYPQIPPKVEYRLTEKGLALGPVFASLERWNETSD